MDRKVPAALTFGPAQPGALFDTTLPSGPTAQAPAHADPAGDRSTEAFAAEADSAFEPSAFESGPDVAASGLRLARRRRALVVLALLGCLGVFVLARWLASTPYVDSHWVASTSGSLVLQASTEPTLAPLAGTALLTIQAQQGPPVPVEVTLLHRSPRWQVRDAWRADLLHQTQVLDAAMAQGAVQLAFSNGATVSVKAVARGFGGLGWLFWLLAGAALVLYLVGWVVALARPQAHNLLYLVMALCQAGNLLAIATETLPGLGLPYGLLALDLPLRLVLDACTGAAIVHAFVLYPSRLPYARRVAAVVWPVSLLAAMLVGTGRLPGAWWWAQGLMLVLGLATWVVTSQSYKREANPFALAMRRFAMTAVTTMLLMSAAVALAASMADLAHGVAVGASVTWYLFLSSLLVLVPFLTGSRRLLREFALLAGISTVATSLDLLFVTLFSVGPFVSLAVAGTVALLLYGGARQFILRRLLGNSMLSTERIFDHLYRSARALQTAPDRYPLLLAQLLRDLFDPLKMQRVPRVPARCRVVNGGAALVVPVNLPPGIRPPGGDTGQGHALMLRFAQRGQRLFTAEDARLAERLVDQLRRAVLYDQAVERGRSEERLRIAQDLHDDIGARLLTLMYQSPTPEMEDYIRHTLQDLKTLTRGLAASDQALSHAAGEWKADLTQRLTAARASLVWSCTTDRDPRLSAVQWSAITRILRELVSNALYHGHATRVEVTLELAGPRLTLRVLDDGQGSDPLAWAHGLGMGGVRKRVKALGGRVSWAEAPQGGIACVVEVQPFEAAPP